jgi:hypothetical protein
LWTISIIIVKSGEEKKGMHTTGNELQQGIMVGSSISRMFFESRGKEASNNSQHEKYATQDI